MKFKPGDLVWARKTQWHSSLPAGEHPGVIVRVANHSPVFGQFYDVELPQKSVMSHYWGFVDSELRPRRDDYQQHESLGHMDEITRPPDLSEDLLEEVLEEVLASGLRIRA